MTKIDSTYFFAILVFVIFSSCNNSKDLAVSDESYYINHEGDTSRVTEYVGDSLFRSTHYRFNDKGKTRFQVVHHLKNAKPHGTSKFYHSNGSLKSIVVYRNGKIWEVEAYKDSSGNDLDYGKINKGDGYLKEYSDDSSILREEGEIIEGYKEGYWIQYCGNGVSICDSTLYTKGKDRIMREIEEGGLPVYQTYR